MSKTQSNPISSNEAQMALFKMRVRDWPRFFIWTQDWNDWQPLDLFLKSDQSYFIPVFAVNSTEEDTVKHNLMRDVLEANTYDEVTQTEITKSYSGVLLNDETSPNQEPSLGKQSFDGDDICWENIQKPELDFKKLKEKMNYGNRSERHNFKIEVLLITAKGKTFRSASQNISLTGALLEDNVPFDYYGLVFDVVIVNRVAVNSVNARATLKATTVGEGLTQRINFDDVTPQQKRTLQGLLQDYLDQQDKLIKKSS
ncbi:MAG: PilZ domain-containing protein [Pseudobdellovibrio sp.]